MLWKSGVRCLLVINLLFLSACERVISKDVPVIVLPHVKDYSGSFQEKLADELEEIQAGPCYSDYSLRSQPEECSAILRVILDYGLLRDKLRVD
jgi:hypothetical protein